MSVISLNGVTHYFGDRCIFKEVSFAVDRDKRIGLVGRNGAGKTTLLEIIEGTILPKEGRITKMRGCQIAYLNQSFRIDTDIPLWNYILNSYKQFTYLEDEIKKLELLVSSDPSEANFKKLDLAHQEFSAIDGYALEVKAKIILQQLGFPEVEWKRSVNSFSGGEKTRIQLASILLKPSDILLLDEPTNHLDLKMRNWLIAFLNDLSTPYILVSHDRYFLDKTTNMTLSIENKSIVSYSGNYTLFQAEFEARQELLRKEFKAQQEWIDEAEEFIRRNMAGQKTKQAQARQKALNKIERIDKPSEDKEYRFSFQSKNRSGNIIYTLDNLSFGFPNKILAQNIDGTIRYRDRLALLGDNGTGKSTFLQLLLGERTPLKGEVKRGASLSVGYYDQLHLSLNGALTVKESVNYEHLDWDNNQVISYLARFGFVDDELEKRVSVLSGGEKARLYLALLIARKPNVLIMDEPTNHLDTFLIASLEQALSEFDGTLIFVSHDRYFIENIATRYWVIKDNRVIETDNWIELLLLEEKKAVKDKKERIIERPKEKKINPIVLDLMLKEIEKFQAEIALKTENLSKLEEKYLDSNFMRDAEKVRLLNLQVAEMKREITELQNIIELKEEEYLNSIV